MTSTIIFPFLPYPMYHNLSICLSRYPHVSISFIFICPSILILLFPSCLFAVHIFLPSCFQVRLLLFLFQSICLSVYLSQTLTHEAIFLLSYNASFLILSLFNALFVVVYFLSSFFSSLRHNYFHFFRRSIL